MLGFWVFTAMGLGSIPGQGTEKKDFNISVNEFIYFTQHVTKKKKSISAEEYIIPHLESEFDLEVNGQKEKKSRLNSKQDCSLAVFRSTVIIKILLSFLFSPVRLFVTPWTVALQAPQSMEVSRQEYWSG